MFVNSLLMYCKHKKQCLGVYGIVIREHSITELCPQKSFLRCEDNHIIKDLYIIILLNF